jgi:hypothetical protein
MGRWASVDQAADRRLGANSGAPLRRKPARGSDEGVVGHRTRCVTRWPRRRPSGDTAEILSLVVLPVVSGARPRPSAGVSVACLVSMTAADGHHCPHGTDPSADLQNPGPAGARGKSTIAPLNTNGPSTMPTLGSPLHASIVSIDPASRRPFARARHPGSCARLYSRVLSSSPGGRIVVALYGLTIAVGRTIVRTE